MNMPDIDRTYNTEVRIRPTRVRLTDTSALTSLRRAVEPALRGHGGGDPGTGTGYDSRDSRSRVGITSTSPSHTAVGAANDGSVR